MSYSLKEAADATGRQKTTILRAIQRDKISATKDAHGEWEIDPAEIHRVYEPATTASAALSKIERLHASINSTEGDATQREIALLREMLADKNAVIEDLREDRDRWRTQAEKLLLIDQRAKAADVIAIPPAAVPALVEAQAAPPARVSPLPAPTDAPAVVAPAEASWWRRMMGGR